MARHGRSVPQRNFLRALPTLTGGICGDGVAVVFGGAQLLGSAMDRLDREAVVAIRPDDLRPCSDGPFAATVEIAEYHGRDYYALTKGANRTEPLLPLRPAANSSTWPLRVTSSGVLGLSATRLSLHPGMREHGLDSVTLLVLPGARGSDFRRRGWAAG